MEASISSSSILLSSSGSADSFVDESLKTNNIIVYAPYIDKRSRSGRYMISSRFFSGDQLTGDCSYLKACFLCKKIISDNHQIFMYRGDAPFCSEDCRQEQIDMDESLEKSRKPSTCTSTLVKSTNPAMKRKPSIIIRPNNPLRTDAATVAS